MPSAGGDRGGGPHWKRQARPERLPLSYAQQRLWFLDRLEGASTEYSVAGALRLRGELDREAVERAINTIVERHESLRTHFGEVEGEPVQVIEPELRIEVPVEDLSGLEEEQQRKQVEAALRREGAEPFGSRARASAKDETAKALASRSMFCYGPCNSYCVRWVVGGGCSTGS